MQPESHLSSLNGRAYRHRLPNENVFEARSEVSKRVKSLPFRVVSHGLVILQIGAAVPAASAGAQTPSETLVIPAVAQSTVPEPATAIPSPESRTIGVSFSGAPTDEEFLRAPVFEEPLVPQSHPALPEEDRQLASLLVAFAQGNDPEAVEPLQAFVAEHPRSRWRASLVMNLGLVYRHTGYFSRALEAFEEAWSLLKADSDPQARRLGDRAVAQLAELNARLGRYERLDRLFDEIQERTIGGSAGELLRLAREGRAIMAREPGRSFRCGPYSLERIWQLRNPGESLPDLLVDAQSTTRGTSLEQMAGLAAAAGLEMQLARRVSPNAAVPLPAMVHWRSGHFATLAVREGNHYRAKDPTFGPDFWLSDRALNDEASGLFLVPAGRLPKGWATATPAEAAKAWGSGVVNTVEPPDPEEPEKEEEEEEECKKQQPMADYTYKLMSVGLKVFDTPLGYSPPRGPSVQFAVEFNQRDIYQTSTPTHSNLGSRWTFGWLSYVEDNPSVPAANVGNYRRGGKSVFKGMASGESLPNPRNQSRLLRVSSSPVRYERRLPDGWIEVYSLAIGSAPTRRIFLTQRIDPQGNAITFNYSTAGTSVKLVSVTDAIGQVTTIDYVPGTLRVSKVTDPFGRFATFAYDADSRLVRITDVIGIESSFSYGDGDFVSSLTTPYGTTSFTTGGAGIARWIEATDAAGATERVEFAQWDEGFGPFPAIDPVVPQGVPTFNRYLTGRNTFFWDKRVHALHAGDYTKAEIFHWLHDDADRFMAVPVLESRKKPLESRIWYAYAGQEVGVEGSSNRPVGIARLLDPIPGVSPTPEHTVRYEYNVNGHPTLIRDPRGRETVIEYASNQIDLTAIKQRDTSNGSLQTLVTATYNTKHRPLTVTDAAGQVTTFTYNAFGQTTSVVTPPRQDLSSGQRTTTYTYDPKGYLIQITRPLTAGGLVFSRDPYGRIRTMTSSDGYTLTADYDALDRLIRLTFPDGTYESRTYNRLDLEQFRDRMGRLVSATYDAEQRLTSIRDGSGRMTAFEWCGCGMMERLVDPNGNATSWERDVQGRVTREVRADGTAWSYVYEGTTSRLKERIDAIGQRTHYEYYLDDFLKRQSYTVVAPQIAAPAVDLVWDAMYPRLTRVATEGLHPIDITYVPVTGTTNLGAGRLQSLSGAFDESTVSYSYDELGRPRTRGLAGAPVTYEYDLLGRVTGVSDPVAGAFGLTYDGPTGRPTSVAYPNGQRSNYEYFGNAGDRRLKTITHLAPNTSVLSRFEYTYDKVGNLQTWQQQLGAAPAKVYDFGYDPADKLIAATLKSTGATPSVLRRHGYGFDRAGNRSASQLDASVIAATFDSRNRILSTQPGGAVLFRGQVNEPATVVIAGQPATTPLDLTFSGQAPLGAGTTLVDVTATDASNRSRTNRYSVSQSGASAAYIHDANGNLTFDGSRTYHWDSENRLVKVTQGTTELARFVYDGWGRRVRKVAGGVTWTYVLDGAHVVQERSSTGPSRRYVLGPGIDRPLARVVGSAVEAFYLADHLGSVVQETNALGAPILTREYDPYGNLLQGATSSGFAFTGREWDAEVGLYFYRARYYSPVLGRFLSEDPIRWRLGHINHYPYVDGNPGRYVDPSGELWGLVVAAVVVAAVVAYIALSKNGPQVAETTAYETFDHVFPNKGIPPIDVLTNMDEIIPAVEFHMSNGAIQRILACQGQTDPDCMKLMDQARAWCDQRKPKPTAGNSTAWEACEMCKEP